VAALPNDAASMRLTLQLVGGPGGAEGGVPGGSPTALLATASIDHFDRRDSEWWPFVRLPALHLGGQAAQALLEGTRELLAGSAPGFAWRSGEAGPLALQLSAAAGTPGVLVEVGVDLGPWLADVAGGQAGGEACLFRFAATRADLVRFADALAAECHPGPAA
jgi:hypothetical protein